MRWFCKILHVIWHCQYYIVWGLKSRHKILERVIVSRITEMFYVFCSKNGYKIKEFKNQSVGGNHIHLIIMIPHKASILLLMGGTER